MAIDTLVITDKVGRGDLRHSSRGNEAWVEHGKMDKKITKRVSHVKEFLFYLKGLGELFRIFNLWRSMTDCHFRMITLAAIGMDWIHEELEARKTLEGIQSR